MHLRKRITRSLGANGLSAVVSFLTQIITIPVFLKFWGKDIYGVWVVIAAIPAALSLSDFGLGASLSNEAVKIGVQAQWGMMRRILLAGAWAQVFVVLVLTAGAMLVLRLGLVWSNSGSVLNPIAGEVYVVGVLGLVCVVSILSNCLGAAYRGCDQNNRFLALVSACRIIELVFLIAAVYFSKSFLVLSIVMFLSKICGVLIVWKFRPREIVLLKNEFLCPDFKGLKVLIPKSLGFMAYAIGNLACVQIVPVVVAHQASYALAAEVSVIRQVSRFGLQVANLFFSGLNPEMTRLLGLRDIASARKLQSVAVLFGGFCLIVGVAIAYWIGPSIVFWWTRGAVRPDALAMALTVAEVLIYNLAGFAILAAWSINEVGLSSISFMLLQGLAIILIAYLNVAELGVAGIAAIFIISNLIQFLVNWLRSRRVLRSL